MNEGSTDPSFFPSYDGNILDDYTLDDLDSSEVLANSFVQPRDVYPNTDLSHDAPQYFAESSVARAQENNAWNAIKPQPYGLPGPDLDGMSFDDQFQAPPSMATTKMDQMDQIDQNMSGLNHPIGFDSYLNSSGIQTSTRGRHGQITPASDSNPGSPAFKQNSPEYDFSAIPQQTIPIRTPTLAEESNAKPCTSASPRKRAAGGGASRRRRNQTRKADLDDSTTEEERERREKFLERNRKAAAKCREKKKAWTAGLQQKYEYLEQEKKMKSQMITQLREELIELKDQIVGGPHCNCPGVADYIRAKADSITGGCCAPLPGT
ncbi:hypothetical protein FQN54_006911 [Arachnomyces sp. PD_36]|nr:hypothetical protein FQN54_006911 [Arachnomyces sp. PD_36]